MTPRTAKGTTRRQHVLEAAAEILIAEGFRAVTHRRVAEAAGVPLGATTYYFTGRGDLIGATIELLLAREQVRRAKVTASGKSLRAVAAALVGLLVPTVGESSRQQAAVIYERLGEALRDDDLRAVVSLDYADLEAHVARILVAMPRALDPALVLALVEGRLLQWLASDRAPSMLVARVAADLLSLGAVTRSRHEHDWADP